MTPALAAAVKNTKNAAVNKPGFTVEALMERHVVEILVILLRQYPEGGLNHDDFEPLTEDLLGLGYTQQEIETALFWFYSKLEIRRNSSLSEGFDTDSFRILHEVERAVLTPEAYGYLVELRQLGILSLSEMDKIIEKAVLLGGRRVSADDIKAFVANTIMEQDAGFPLFGRAIYLKMPTDFVQ